MGTKSTTHHIAIDSQGYLLAGSPEKPKRSMQRNTVFGTRFATGDRDYTDFSLWWYWAQTDWTGGIKDNRGWEDDAKFYYSTNLDAFSEQGAIKLAPSVSKELSADSDSIHTGAFGVVNGTIHSYFGTHESNTTDEPLLYEDDGTGWDVISDGNLSNTGEHIYQILIHKGSAYILIGAGSQTVVEYDGSGWTDHSAAINTAVTDSILSATAGVEHGGVLYIAGHDSGNDNYKVVYTDDAGTSWTELFNVEIQNEILDIAAFSGDYLYYLLIPGSGSVTTLELRKYDIANSVDSHVYTFKNVSLTTASSGAYIYGGKLMHLLNGKLVITIPNEEVWEMDSSENFVRKYKRDDNKNDIGKEAVGFLDRGGVEKDNKIYWGNLIYDGLFFYNYTKDNDDSTSEDFFPLFVDHNNIIYWGSTEDESDLFEESSTAYKSGADKNFIEFSEIEEVSTIDKLAYSLTILFDKFDDGEEIEVRYSTDGGENFTVLGSAGYTLDGTSVTQKTFLFGDDVSFNKMIVRVYLNSDGTSTPKLKDISMQYLPIPDYKYRWSFVIDCGDKINVLDDISREIKSGEELRNLLRASFLKKEIVDLEDVDYAETKINDASPSADDTTIVVDSTEDFPEQGRLKIGDEEILYTGKTRSTFTGCTRGYRGTNAADHADDDVVSNKYKILITDYSESTPLAESSNISEFLVSVELLEV